MAHTNTTTDHDTLTAADIAEAWSAFDFDAATARIAAYLLPAVGEHDENGAAVLTGDAVRAVFSGRVEDAVQRAERLDHLRAMAEVAMPAATAAEQLGFETEEAFVTWLESDAEAGSIWRAGRIAFAVEARRKLAELMDKGNAAAIRQVLAEFDDRLGGAADLSAVPAGSLEKMLGENPQWIKNRVRHDGCPRNVDGTVDLAAFLPWYRRHVEKKETFDPNRVRMVDLEPFLGVSRQTLNKWTADGMPRNIDGTFSLAAVFTWRLEQVGHQTQKQTDPVNPLTAEKVRKLQREHDVAMHNLLDRGEVMSGIAARLRSVVNFMDRKIGEAGTALEGQTADAVTVYVEKLFGEIRTVLKQVPEELKLPDDAAAAFGDCLRILSERDGSQPQMNTNEHEKNN